MRKLIGTIAVAAMLLLPALSARAQVAVPRLVPAAPLITGVFLNGANFVTLNPAAMQWGAPSRLGAGVFSGERQQTAPTVGAPTDRDGNYAGLRLVGESVSFAVQAINLSVALPAQENETVGAALAFQVGESWAFGLGLWRFEATLPTVVFEREGKDVGLSWQFSEGFFLGLALGRESQNVSTTGDAERGVSRLGIGYRAGGDVLWHFEAYAEEREDVRQSVPVGTGSAFRGMSTTGLVAEVNWGGFLLSLSREMRSIEQLNADQTVLWLDVGYAPAEGLAVLLHRENLVDERPGGFRTETTFNAVSVAWSF